MFYVKVCGIWQAIGRKREALSDQKGVFLRGVFETSCATHGEKRSLDGVSESRTPQFRKDCAYQMLPHGWHHQMSKGVVHCRGCLYLWGEDLRMFPEVQDERVAGPMPLHLHDIERDAPQEIFEGGSNLDSMALQGLQSGCASSLC